MLSLDRDTSNWFIKSKSSLTFPSLFAFITIHLIHAPQLFGVKPPTISFHLRVPFSFNHRAFYGLNSFKKSVLASLSTFYYPSFTLTPCQVINRFLPKYLYFHALFQTTFTLFPYDASHQFDLLEIHEVSFFIVS